MLLIERNHPSVETVVHRMLNGQNVVPRSDIRDFDHCLLRVKVTIDEEDQEALSASQTSNPTDPNSPVTHSNPNSVMAKGEIMIRLRHNIPNNILNKFKNYEKIVGSNFPKNYFSFDEEKKGATVTIPKNASPKVRDEVLNLASQLRTLSFIPIFMHQAQEFMNAPTSVVPLCLPYRPTESMYLFTNKKGDFYVVVSLVVESKDDQLFVKNFLQSFVDIKRQQPSIASAPGFFFSQKVAPQDLPKEIMGEPENDDTFWCTFQLSKIQLEKPDRVAETARQLVNFRNNLMYHIHCCRTYMHAGMRKRVENAVHILARAKTSTTGKAKVQLK
eukprot:Tbor_TRINITY_DN5467_c5_g1::TRINITY_DN5467_c5_g1_i1::g.24715::m.24715/K05758/ARPC2; actin related protein 2/3 complex, subunit 2